METETPTPSLTPEPTITPTPTLALYTEMVLNSGNGARFERTVTAGDFTISLLLFVLIVLITAQFLYTWLRGWKAERR